MEIRYYKSPVGILKLVEEEEKLIEVSFSDVFTDQDSGNGVLNRTVDQLNEYFEGSRQDFNLPLAPAGTGFQQKVWSELCNIVYGSTLTYLELAERLNDPKSVRAVGKANGQNRIAIIIPCHRVIGADGKLTGYSGGVERKQWLLKHEGALLL